MKFTKNEIRIIENTPTGLVLPILLIIFINRFIDNWLCSVTSIKK